MKEKIIEIQYLYTRSNIGDVLNRYRVTRQTDDNIWIYVNEKSECKISKKTYKTGSGWDILYYMKETPELKNEYEFKVFKYNFNKKLESLKDCKNVELMKSIIELINKEADNAIKRI